MRCRLLAVLGCCVVAAACGEQPTDSARPTPRFGATGLSTTCVSADSVEALITAVFPAGKDRSSALSRYRQILKELGPKPPGPDTATARNHAINLVEFILNKYQDGKLIGGQSPATQLAATDLLNGILCTVGLPPAFGLGTLGEDGAAEIVSPSSGSTVVVTETQTAGVDVPGGSITEPTLFTITRLPDFPGPLLTSLDQYPFFYEFSSTSGAVFSEAVTVGVCLPAGVVPPDESRLRIAHNIPPFTPGSIEILPLVPAPFLDCTDASLGALPGGQRPGFFARSATALGRALGELFGPAPLYAARKGTSGLGGTVRTFSPFGAVDTLGILQAASPLDQRAHFGDNVPYPPAVLAVTPTGNPMAGVPVTFAVTAGGGSVAPSSVFTDAAGRAATSSWTMGFSTSQAVSATASGPAGSGFAGSPVVFTATSAPR